MEELLENDHRVIGKNLDLFAFSDLVGKGLPMLTPKGAIIRRELEKFVVEEETKRGYQHVLTPPLAKTDLYRQSGHYPYYKDTMYPEMKIDDEELILRPMTCPHHFMLYKDRPRSYKELPVRYAELASLFRYEKSGELSGLTRVRNFCLADAHIICKPDQALSEIKLALDLIEYMNNVLGLTRGQDYTYRLSLGDRNDTKKYYKDDAAWDQAEEILRTVLVKSEMPFVEAKGEAAFYGPKIDIQVKKPTGKEETAFTVQYDFVMPKRFNLTYIRQSGGEKEPVVIHRSSIGAFERTMAFLIEKYSGAFPVWLSPVQVMVIPIADRHAEYSKKVVDVLKEAGIRAEIDDRSETMQARLRDAQMQKVPYMLMVGDKEMASPELTAAVRLRSGESKGPQKVSDFITAVKSLILTRSLVLW